MHQRFKSLKNYGCEELEQLEDSRVAVVGLGATGSVIAENLARHGVELVLIDRDYLEDKDLYTSNIYSRDQVESSVPKAVAAEDYLQEFTEVESHPKSLGSGNLSLLENCDLVLDGTDNLETRFLIGEFCKKSGAPWIYTAAISESGYSMFFQDECFNCVFDEIKAGSLETCETAGIMREASQIAASISSWKAVRYLAGKEVEEVLETVHGEKFSVESDGCEVCEEGKYSRINSPGTVSSVCGENKYQLEREVTGTAFDRLRNAGEVLADNDYLLRVSVEGKEFVLFRSGRAIIEARDQGHAEERFSEIIGD